MNWWIVIGIVLTIVVVAAILSKDTKDSSYDDGFWDAWIICSLFDMWDD